MLKIFHAPWVLPISAPVIRNGAVVVNSETHEVVEVGSLSQVTTHYSTISPVLIPESVILPGLINAHTHLELSMMKGLIPKGLSFSDWVYQAITRRFEFTENVIRNSCLEAISGLIETGTVAVGDIANSSTVSKSLLPDFPIFAVIFHELTGFQESVAEARLYEFTARLKKPLFSETITAHAPYSVSPKLFGLIRDFTKKSNLPSSIHTAESPDEKIFLQSGDGPMRTMIEKLGRWDDSWKFPKKSPVGYLSQLGMLDAQSLLVHMVHTDEQDIAIVKENGCSICLCPRSNEYIDVKGPAPVRRYLDENINVCLGTDSLASNDDLNLWNEMYHLKTIVPSLNKETILRMATANGAAALGLKALGTIEPGKSDALIAVRSGGSIDDPEDFLLSGYTNFKSITRLDRLS